MKGSNKVNLTVGIDQTYEALSETVTLLEFKNSLPSVMRAHVEELKLQTVRLAAEKANDSELFHQSKFGFQYQSQPVRDRNWGMET